MLELTGFYQYAQRLYLFGLDSRIEKSRMNILVSMTWYYENRYVPNSIVLLEDTLCPFKCWPYLASVFFAEAAIPPAQAPHMIEVAAHPQSRACSAQPPSTALAAA